MAQDPNLLLGTQETPEQQSISLLDTKLLAAGSIFPRHLAATTAQALGDLYYSDGTKFVRLPKGDDGQVLTQQIDGTVAWATPAPVPALSSKIITASRDLTAATGDVAYTGVGFQPTAIIALANTAGLPNGVSWGLADSIKTAGRIEREDGNFYQDAQLIYISQTGGNSQKAIIKSYDADGFTLTWTKAGAPTGTGSLIFLCFK